MIKDIFKIQDLLPIIFNLDRDKYYDVEIKEHKDKRSLQANNYAWLLIGKLGNVLGISKEEIYLDMLRNYGQFEIISVLEKVNLDGYLKYYEQIGEGFVDGKKFKHIKVYKGSSEFDTKEMAIFIDGIVQECENLGIETMTPDKLEELKSLWKSQ